MQLGGKASKRKSGGSSEKVKDEREKRTDILMNQQLTLTQMGEICSFPLFPIRQTSRVQRELINKDAMTTGGSVQIILFPTSLFYSPVPLGFSKSQ